MSQPIISTKRLQLVPLTKEHLPFQIMMDADEETMKYLGGSQSPSDCEKEINEILINTKRGLGYWAGFIDNEFAGYWILCVPYEIEATPSYNSVYGPKTGELGYRLLRKFWRQGLAKEGSIALIDYGFQTLNLDNIISRTDINNIPSQATMKSLGLVLNQEFYLGSEKGVEYQMTHRDWEKLNIGQ